jgi:transposase-like protein
MYRAVDSQGNTLDFIFSDRRSELASKIFFKKMLKAKHIKQPEAIDLNKNLAYPPAIEELKVEKVLDKKGKIRQVEYLNNLGSTELRM